MTYKFLLRMIALLLLTLMAVQPFLRGVMPLTADGTLHLYRLVTYDHAVSDGTLWARYVAGTAFGYGAPLFNYYSPVSLMPMQLLHVLGLTFMQAWLVGMMFYTFAAGVGAYLLGRVWAGEIAGIVAAAAYVYAPYTLFDSIWRGTVSELASLAMLPFVLWALWRLAYCGKRSDFFLTAVSFALFVLMHNVITLHGGALIGVYTLYLWWTTPDKTRSMSRLGVGLLVGLMLAAFFWFPAITETDYVKINGITATLAEIDVTRNLLTLGDVFELPMTVDPRQIQPPIPIALSWVQLLLALPAVFSLFLPGISRRLRGFMIVSLLLLAGLVFMNLHASAGVWNVVPLIRYSQFPWRLVGLASLLLAVLAGIGVSLIAERVKSHRGQIALVVVSLVLIMVYAMPWIYSIDLPELNPQTIVDAQNFEREEGFIATSSFGEYLPRWNSELPDTARLAPRYAENSIIPRLDPPQGVTITNAEWRNTSTRLTFIAETETDLIFDWFYFPGWWATLDGQPLEMAPTEPEGLLQVTVPAGEHTLEVALGLTSRQQTATLMSLGGALALIIGTFLWKASPPFETRTAFKSDVWLTVAVIGITIFAAKTLVIDRINSPIRQERSPQVMVNANFNREITLLGYDLPANEVRSAEEFELNLYWQLRGEKINEDYSTVVTLRDSQGIQVAQVILWQPAGLSTSNWLPGYYLQERVKLPIPPGTPPGTYTLDAALYSPDESRSLDVINASDNPEDVKVRLTGITVNRPLASQTVEPEIPITNDNFESIDLIGLDAFPTPLSVGQEFILSWVWEAKTQTSVDQTFNLVWIKGGFDWAVSPLIAPVAGYSDWQEGDVWRGLHRLYVPGNLETGRYAVAVVDATDPLGTVPLIDMNVTAPERVFDVPEMQNVVDAEWQNGLRLLGYEQTEESLMLYWQTSEPLYQNLRVFVHVVDSNGQIVNQRDRIPADWSRPTTGWAANEVITDVYDLQPAEGQTVRIGWYDPLTGDRILLDNGGDTLELK